MSKQISSIDWFHEKTWELKMLLEKQQISIGEYGVAYYDIFQEAKDMHKAEITETASTYFHECTGLTPEQYYKETYGGNNEQ